MASGPIFVGRFGDGQDNRRPQRDRIKSIDVIGAESCRCGGSGNVIVGDKAAFDLDHATGTHSDRRH
ncbi:hypothetical protein ACTZWT_12495 [Rhodopseudomonas sp. NSM]